MTWDLNYSLLRILYKRFGSINKTEIKIENKKGKLENFYYNLGITFCF